VSWEVELAASPECKYEPLATRDDEHLQSLLPFGNHACWRTRLEKRTIDTKSSLNGYSLSECKLSIPLSVDHPGEHFAHL
jgi:hypothetical protein